MSASSSSAASSSYDAHSYYDATIKQSQSISAEHTLQGGRNMTMISRGQPILSMFDMLNIGNEKYIIGVMSSTTIVQAAIDYIFIDDTSARNVTTEELISMSEKYSSNPASLGRIFDQLLQRWLNGDAYTSIISYAVASPSLPLSSPNNDSIQLTVHHKNRIRFNRQIHFDLFAFRLEKVVDDENNYVYIPQRQNSNGKEYRIVIYSIGTKYGGTAIKNFECGIFRIRSVDMEWYNALSKRMEKRMVPTVVARIIERIIIYIQSKHADFITSRNHQILFSFQREKKHCRLSFAENEPISISGNALVVEIARLRAYTAKIGPLRSKACKQCNINNSTVRCIYCNELIYCTNECRAAHFSNHSQGCKIYLKQISGISAPPGGVGVPKKH
jgi:hypothetical protein